MVYPLSSLLSIPKATAMAKSFTSRRSIYNETNKPIVFIAIKRGCHTLEEKVRISPFELTVLTILFTTGTTFLVIPATMAAETKQDAWLSSLLGIIICSGLAYFFILCGRNMGRKNYIQYLEEVYGKIFGKMIGFLYVFFSFIRTATLLSYVGFFTTTHMLTNTPIEIFHIMLAILIILVARAGLEVLARTGELLILWVFFLLAALFIFLLPEVSLNG
jgi:spore germination protein KB